MLFNVYFFIFTFEYFAETKIWLLYSCVVCITAYFIWNNVNKKVKAKRSKNSLMFFVRKLYTCVLKQNCGSYL